MKLLTVKGKDLLFADREDSQAAYSEFHMSAGERALLRISKDISRLKGALVLIDEVEAGLHPYTQQQFMLELQRLALRNDLQIIVTSHSPVVLESVPTEGRVFLERTRDNVIVQPAFRDVFQRAFYGRPQDKLSVLCEDDVGEALILGVMDRLNPLMQLTPDDITVGRDTGKDQFAQHIHTLGKFKLLDEFVFVLDGDARPVEAAMLDAAMTYNRTIRPLFLPGNGPPETWIYSELESDTQRYAEDLGVMNLETTLKQLRQQFDNASDKPTNVAKARFATLADTLGRTSVDIARRVGRIASEKGDLKVFADELMQSVADWRSRTIA
jgi:hypothetical protein